jgi:chromosome segregation ATPase
MTTAIPEGPEPAAAQTQTYDESVQKAVARETARRKRVFSAFISLLLVPIAIGAYALSKAPREAQKVATDVAPIVTQRVGADISAGITNNVIAQTQPIIQKDVAREISASVEPRLAAVTTLRQDITNLQQTTQKVSDVVANVTPQLASVSGLGDRLTSLQGLVSQHEDAFKTISSDQASFRQDLAKTRESTQNLSMKIGKVDAMANDLELSRKQMQEFRQAVTNELGSIRSLVNSDVQAANANKEAIGSLNNRLSGIEGELRKLQARATIIERSKDEKKP